MLRFVWCGTLEVGVRCKGYFVLCAYKEGGVIISFLHIYRRLLGGLDSWIGLGSAVRCGVGGMEDRSLEAQIVNAVLVEFSFVRMRL